MYKTYTMNTTYSSCIDACLACAAACDHCASSCLREKDVEMMTLCIELDLECSSMCRTTAQLMQLESSRAGQLAELCAESCDACADECEKHDNEHCRICAQKCRACAETCREMTAA